MREAIKFTLTVAVGGFGFAVLIVVWASILNGIFEPINSALGR